MKNSIRMFLAAVFSLLVVIPVALAQGGDAGLTAAVQKALGNSRYKDVQVSVQGGVTTLTGSVELLDYKISAEKKAEHVKGVDGVRNQIQVAGPTLSDAELQDKLVKAISYDRVGYGTTAFNSISVAVQNGVVTLGGYAYAPNDAASATALVTYTKGVKDLIDDITVNPPSPNDDRIRQQAFRAIYGYPSLNKYAIDPAKPIRIQVSGGHLALYGQVDSQNDKTVAGLRANGVPGVFSVDNNLVVAGSTPSKEK